jgi:hypothetical protein
MFSKTYLSIFSSILIISNNLYSNENNTSLEFDTIQVEEELLLQKEDFLQNAPMQKQITVQDALKIAGSNGDPINALKTFAGVTSANNNGAEIIIHGSKPRETEFTINHLPLGYTFHFGGLYSVISPEATKQIDAYLGAFDASYYGMGAVVDITPNYPTGSGKKRVHIGMYDADFALDESLGENTSVFLGARRSYFDFIADKVMDEIKTDDSNEEKKLTFTLFPQFYDMNFILNHQYENNLFSIESIKAEDKFKLNSTLSGDKDPLANGKINQEKGFWTNGLRWVYYGEDYTSNTLLYRLETHERLELFDNDYFVDFDLTLHGLHHDTKFINDKHITTFGVELTKTTVPLEAKITKPPESDDYDYHFSSEKVIEEKETYNSNSQQFYLQDIYSINEKLKVRYGARYMNVNFQNFGDTIDPRGAIIYDYSDSTNLSFALGQYSQMPNEITATKKFGNPKLDTFEKANHYSFRIANSFTNSSNLELEPYYKTIQNLAIDDTANTYESVGTGEAYGIDITYKKNIFDMNLIAAYTYIKTKRQLKTDDTKEYTFYGEIPHTLQINFNKEVYKGWNLSTLFKFSNGLPYTPVVGTTNYKLDENYNQVFEDDANYASTDGEVYKKPIFGTPNSKRLPNLYDLDIKFTKTWGSKKNNTSHEFAIELMNISALFHDNVEDIRYNDDYEKEGYYYQMGFLPAFHYTYRF